MTTIVYNRIIVFYQLLANDKYKTMNKIKVLYKNFCLLEELKTRNNLRIFNLLFECRRRKLILSTLFLLRLLRDHKDILPDRNHNLHSLQLLQQPLFLRMEQHKR